MKNLVLAISLLFLVGCGGGSSSSNNNVSETEDPTVSNKGFSHNQYGYYGENVIFGNKKIKGEWQMYGINPDGTIQYVPTETRYQDEEFQGAYDNRWTTMGVYGVSEDGKTLTNHYDLFNKNLVFVYAGEAVSVKNKYTNVQRICMKVYSNADKKYFAFCR